MAACPTPAGRLPLWGEEVPAGAGGAEPDHPAIVVGGPEYVIPGRERTYAMTIAGQERYGDRVFTQDRPDELIRLQALADTYDPVSRTQIQALPLVPGSRCLDVGAGSGTIATWLSEQDTSRQVIALDRDTRMLTSATTTHPGVRMVQADLTETDLDLGTFDLIHARFVLMHLRQRHAVFSRLVSWVRPGGWIILSDFADLTVHVATDRRWAHMVTALWTSLTATIGTDIGWGRRYPTLLRQAGLSDIGTSVHLPSADSASPGATFWRLTLEQARDRIVEGGYATAADVEQVVAALKFPGFTDLSPAMVTAWARRPEAA
jgi:2-polyprenyl-3-methyl-5-hydroxy-6-metoxy-1,4-benzoquinol methylase